MCSVLHSVDGNSSVLWSGVMSVVCSVCRVSLTRACCLSVRIVMTCSVWMWLDVTG